MSVVLITGCTNGGIGWALVNEFASKGCTVYATSRRLDSMHFEQPNVHTLPLDVTSDTSVAAAVSEILDKEGRIDIVVNNAGRMGSGPLIDNSLDSVQDHFDTNAFSILRVAKAVIPAMAKRRDGLIINIGSIVGEVATPWNGLYVASKAACHAFTDVLQMECRPLGIRTMLVAPGSIRSNLSDNESKRFQLAENSLYKDYLPNIIKRIYISQQNPMPAETFAEKVVSKALQKNPPYFLTLGPNSTTFWILKRLVPRVFALGLLWRMFSRKA